MMLLLHILIALGSVVSATLAFFRPSTVKLDVSYGLMGLTLISGVLLIMQSQGHILETCITGILYVGAVSVLIVQAQRRLAAQRIQDRNDVDR